MKRLWRLLPCPNTPVWRSGVVGVIGLPFYIGNIYGAVNAAKKFAIGVKRDLRGQIAVSLDY